jgi:uncharacterized integral membrane protein (TIGR00698 family)
MTKTSTETSPRGMTAATYVRSDDSASIWPGLLLTAAIAASSFGLRALPGVAIFSPMILSIVLGIALHNSAGTPKAAKAGVVFSLRRILRFAIILLGLQLTVAQVVEVGERGILIIAGTLVCTFLFTVWLGRMIGVNRKLAELIAAGMSICGASAVIATNTVTDAHDEDVAYAVACVTVFGSIAMFVYPLLPGLLHLDAHAYGLWAGASIHEIAQVIAAAYQDGQAAGSAAAIAKLSRVAMLAPVVIVLGILAARRSKNGNGSRSTGKVPMPWFVLGFIALVAVNSVITFPVGTKTIIIPVTTFLLSMALAAMGLETDVVKLKAKGIRPLILGFAAFLFVATFSLGLVEVLA